METAAHVVGARGPARGRLVGWLVASGVGLCLLWLLGWAGLRRGVELESRQWPRDLPALVRAEGDDLRVARVAWFGLVDVEHLWSCQLPAGAHGRLVDALGGVPLRRADVPSRFVGMVQVDWWRPGQAREASCHLTSRASARGRRNLLLYDTASRRLYGWLGRWSPPERESVGRR